MYDQTELDQKSNGHPALPASTASSGRERLVLLVAAILGLALLGGMGWAIWALLQPGAPTETIRDVFIIVLALEFMLVGVALVVLVVQLAKLVNMLQNEVRPILDSASEAANTLRGTAQFLSDKMVSPVVKVNGAIAALRRAADMLNFGRK